MRLFSIIQWHHFAYMMISLALLGYGVSGAFLMLLQRRLLQRFAASYLINLALFGISSVGCFLLAQHIPFNAEEVFWDARQSLWLLCTYLLLAVPFFFAANAIGLALIRYRARLSSIYAADLIGAGLGGIAILVLLFAVLPAAGTDDARPARHRRGPARCMGIAAKARRCLAAAAAGRRPAADARQAGAHWKCRPTRA